MLYYKAHLCKKNIVRLSYLSFLDLNSSLLNSDSHSVKEERSSISLSPLLVQITFCVHTFPIWSFRVSVRSKWQGPLFCMARWLTRLIPKIPLGLSSLPAPLSHLWTLPRLRSSNSLLLLYSFLREYSFPLPSCSCWAASSPSASYRGMPISTLYYTGIDPFHIMILHWSLQHWTCICSLSAVPSLSLSLCLK